MGVRGGAVSRRMGAEQRDAIGLAPHSLWCHALNSEICVPCLGPTPVTLLCRAWS